MNSNLNNKELIVFDVDGVILDSQKIYIGAAKYMCEQLSKQTGVDYTQSEEEYKRHAADSKAPHKIFPPELIDEAYRLFMEFSNEQTHPERYGLIDQVQETLEVLREKFQLAFFSSKSKIGLDLVMDHHNIHELIDHSLSRDCVPEAKPSPIGLQMLMYMFKTKADNVIMIGDSLFDFQSAQKAGVDFIGVNSGVFDPHNWDELGVAHIESMANLKNI